MSYIGDLTATQHIALHKFLHQSLAGVQQTLLSIWPTPLIKDLDHNDLNERELKILNISIGETMQTILSLGGKLTFHGSVSDTYYYFLPEDKRKLIESLRIRTKNNEHYLTIKKRNTSKVIKERLEREIHLPDPKYYESLFLNVGLEPLYSREKVRFSYYIGDQEHGDITIDIDLYPGIPPMLELEGTSEQHLMLWIKRLGLEQKKSVNRTARKTLEYYRKKKDK